MKIILMLSSLLSLLLNVGCQNKKHAEAHESTFVATSPILVDTIIYQEYVCQIHSIQHIELRAIERGYLKNIYVDEGQAVKKGQLLFQVMPLIYQSEVGIAQAEANYAKMEYQNTKALADSNIVSPNELALVKAKLDKANAALRLAETHLSFTEIRAPFDGILGRFQVRLGSLLEEGELLSTLSDNSKMWVYFNVPEAEYLDYVSTTTINNLPHVKLHMANNDLFEHEGKIETIEADFNNETGNIAFRATFPNPQRILRHGETGNILMPVKLNRALLIPQKATFEILDKKYVFVVGENNIAESRQIIIGVEMPHLYSVIDGIKESDKILVEGIRKVKNNQKIKYDFIPQREIMSELTQLHAE